VPPGRPGRVHPWPASMPAADDPRFLAGNCIAVPAGSRPASGTGGAGPAGDPPGLLPARLLPAICKSTIRIYDHDCRLCLTRGFRYARARTRRISDRSSPGMHAGAGECNRREELMILILPAGQGCPDNLPILSVVPGPHENSGASWPLQDQFALGPSGHHGSDLRWPDAPSTLP
jgi:hypothetical protein